MKKIIKRLLKINKKIKILLVIGLLVLVFGFIFYKKNSQKKSYQTTKPIRETLIESVTASGQILNSSAEIVYTQASGRVKSVFVKNNQIVKKGDKILEIEFDQLGQKQYQSALASYLSAKSSLDSAQVTLMALQAEMFDKWQTFYNMAISSTYQNSDGSPNEANRQLPEFMIAKNNWLAAEAKYKNQQNQINQAQAALSSAWLAYQLASPVVTAPTDGKISDLIYDVGMLVNNSSSDNGTSSQIKIATIKSQSLPVGKFTVSEIDVSKIKSGQKATITIDALANKTYTGEVIAIDKTGEVSSSVVSYPLTIKLDSQAEEILPNMTATANIIVNKKNNVLTVPSSAIINQNNSSYIRVLKNNQAILVLVETGIVSDSKTEIVSGLSENDQVIISVNNNTSSTNTSQSPFSSFGLGSGTRIRMR